LTRLAVSLAEELARVSELIVVGAAAAGEAPGAYLEAARAECGTLLRRRVEGLYRRAPVVSRKAGQLDLLSVESRKLHEFEEALARVSPAQVGLRRELLAPLGAAWARGVLANEPARRIGELVGLVQSVVDRLQREGISPREPFETSRVFLEARLRELTRSMEFQLPLPTSEQALSGEAYATYTRRARDVVDGETQALRRLSQVLEGVNAETVVPPALGTALGSSEVASLSARVAYLAAWYAALPKDRSPGGRERAERAYDALGKSRFPTLALGDGELLHLEALLAPLLDEPGAVGEQARDVARDLAALSADFHGYTRGVLDARVSG
jgi:hypothetical protein